MNTSRFSKMITITTLLLGIMAQPVLSATVEQVNEAAYQNNIETLKSYTETSGDYATAFANYRLAQLHFTKPDKKVLVEQYLKEAADSLKNKTDNESKVLYSSVLGMQMGLNPDLAPSLAPTVARMLAEAMADPASAPRAYLIQGINSFYTPPAYGGGADKARKELKKSVELFKNQHNTSQGGIVWGEAEAHIWLGKIDETENKFSAALEHYRDALAAEPSCEWAQYFVNKTLSKLQ